MTMPPLDRLCLIAALIGGINGNYIGAEDDVHVGSGWYVAFSQTWQFYASSNDKYSDHRWERDFYRKWHEWK